MPHCVLLLICVVICASLQALMQLWVLNLLLLLAMGRPGHHLISVEQKCSSLLIFWFRMEEHFIRAKNCFKSILFCHFIIMIKTNLLQKNLITYEHKGNQPHPIYNKYIGIGQFMYSITQVVKRVFLLPPGWSQGQIQYIDGLDYCDKTV